MRSDWWSGFGAGDTGRTDFVASTSPIVQGPTLMETTSGPATDSGSQESPTVESGNGVIYIFGWGTSHDMPFVPRRVRRALADPSRIPPYLSRKTLGKIFPRSRWATWGLNVIKRDGLVTFRNGNFVAGPENRPEFCARQYHELSTLSAAIRRYIDGETVSAALEIGCGYGRLTPWIAGFVDEMHAIDPDEWALEQVERLYPEIATEQKTAGSMSFPEDRFDLVVSWTVLQHVSEEDIERTTTRINEVLGPGCIALITESVGEYDGPKTWGRSESEYARLLDMELVHSVPKPVERTFEPGDGPLPSSSPLNHTDHRVMLFQN